MSVILAHRGASKERPENTMAAFRRAEELNAFGLETDVHLLPDGTMIVRHDDNLGRCENASGSIYSFSEAELQKIPVGKNHPGKFENETMPSFGELLQWLQSNRMYLNVEIKPGGFLSEIGEQTVQALEEYRMKDRCIISSFDHHILHEIKQRHPDYKVGILYGQPNDDVINYCLKYGFDAIHPHYRLISRSLVRACHENGIAVNVWTVDEPDDIRRMIEWGVDAVISNDAATARDILNSCCGNR